MTMKFYTCFTKQVLFLQHLCLSFTGVTLITHFITLIVTVTPVKVIMAQL